MPNMIEIAIFLIPQWAYLIYISVFWSKRRKSEILNYEKRIAELEIELAKARIG